MQPHTQKAYYHDKQAERPSQRSPSALPALLWTLWTIAVIAASYLSWQADVVARRPLNLLGLVVHCGLVGVIGLVALTVIEIRLEPWRFLE
jgi:hypothetical protein